MDKELYNYMQEVRQYEILSNEEQKELILKAKLNNDRDAFLKVYHSNLLLVVKIASKYYFPFINLTIMDLIQEGNVALLTAMNNYDVKYINTNKVSSYVYRIVNQCIAAYIQDNANVIRIPRNKIAELKQYNKKYEYLLNELQRKPTIEELAKELNMTKKNVLILSKLNLIFNIDSLNKLLDDDDELMYFIPNKEEDFTEKYANEQQEKDITNFIFNCLTEKRAKVISLLYGFDGNGKKGYQEVANILGYKDRRNVESLERRSLKKLKTKLENWDYFNKIEK